MKVALENGEVLDIALVEGDRIIGTLSLQLKGLAGAPKAGRPAAASQQSESAASAPNGRKARKPRKPMSPEGRARMAAAQKLRWEQKRGGQDNKKSEDSN